EQEPRPPSQRVTRGEHARDRAKARRSDVRQLVRRLHHDLDWIVLKALEKDRNRRYASASELAADIERYLEGRPVVAGPRSTRYRLARFMRRHRSLLALGSLAVTLLIAGIIGTTLGLLRAQQEAERARVQTDIAREVHSFLTQDLLSAVAPDQQGVEVTMRQVLDQAGQRIEGKFQAQPRVEAALRQTLGSTYHSLGVYDAAETHLRRALEIHDELQGPEHADTLQVTYILGTLHRLQGRYDEAETLLSRAASHRRDLRGEVSELERSAFRALATLYQVSGRHAESEAFYLETLREREERLGRNSLSTVGVMSELSILYQHSNRLAEAEGLQAHVYQVWYEQLGPEHPTTLNSAINLSALYLRLERYDEAETVLLEALGPMRRVMGEEHPRSLMMANNLGYCYVQQRRFAEAEPVLIENYTIKRRVLGATHPSVIEAVENLVDLYQGMDEAEKLRRYSTEFLRLTGQRARESGASARDLNRYARQLLTTAAVDLRDPAAALRFALAANEQTSHGDARMLETLALAYAGTGELDRALATAHRAVEANPDKTTAFHRQLEAAVARYQQLQIAG
ncbi:MAG: tetratricopeptide repeat protein, partial [Acidobacteriota bacterium]